MGGKGPLSTERRSAAEASDGAIAGGAMMGADTSVAGGMAGAAGVRRPTTKPPKVKPKDRTPVETYWALEKRSHDARREKLDRTLPSLFIAKQYTDWLADPNNKIERVPAWARELAKRIPHAHHHHHHHQQAAGGGGRTGLGQTRRRVQGGGVVGSFLHGCHPPSGINCDAVKATAARCTRVAQGTQAYPRCILHPPGRSPRKTPGRHSAGLEVSRWPVFCVHAATAVRDHRVCVFVCLLLFCVYPPLNLPLSERFSLSRVLFSR